MPNYLIKILLLFFLILFQAIDIKAQNEIAQKGDSLFSAKQYSEAAKIYELIFADKSVNKENLNLKLAFIYENMADYPRTLYYLSNYYNLKPSDEVFEKMNKIALENKKKSKKKKSEDALKTQEVEVYHLQMRKHNKGLNPTL